MAAIEKICEFSDEYPNCPVYGGGWIMRKWKRNHIQIMPKYRKEFRGAKATLRILETDIREYYRGRTCYSSPCVSTAVHHDETAEDYIWNEQQKGKAFVVEYKYCLEVEDEALQGRVKGKYYEWSCDMNSVIRRLRRMVGPQLEIVREVPCRSQIMRDWKKQFNADIAAYKEKYDK